MPSGNIFVQRKANSTSPLATVPVNATGAYILPGITRTVSSTWSDGFPVYKTDTATQKSKLFWDWGSLQKFRFGHYVAKAVVIYNDGNRDIPVEASVGFWVIPWRLLLLVFVVVVLMVIGVVTIVRKTARFARNKHEPKQAA